MTDRRFRALTDRVSDNGKLWYTPEQLVLYAVRKPRTRWKSNLHNIIAYTTALIALLVVIVAGVRGLATDGVSGAETAMETIAHVSEELGELTLLIVGCVVYSAISVGKLALHRLGLRRNNAPLSYVQERDLLQGAYSHWPQVYGSLPLRLLFQEGDAPDQQRRPPAKLRAVLVCPDRPVLRCLDANDVPERLGLALLPTAPLFTPGEQSTRELLRRDHSIPILLLHDASPEGCVLAETVRATLGLNPKHWLVDVGLRPRDVVKHHWLTLHERPSAKSLQRLRELAATAEHPGMKSVIRLDAEELKWLEAGNYSPARALTPKQLIALVTRAVERVMRAATRRNDEVRAEQQAKVLGFLTWPEA